MGSHTFEIVNESKGKDRFWAFFLWLVGTIVYVEFWVKLIIEEEMYNIYGDSRHLMWIIVAILIYVPVFIILKISYVNTAGDVTITIDHSELVLKRRTEIFKSIKNYDLQKITKVRIIDFGKNNFDVGFNYKPTDKLVVLGEFKSEEEASELLNWVTKEIEETSVE